MGIREALNRKGVAAIAIVAVVVLVGIGSLIWVMRPGTDAAVKRAFYSTDDGKTYFADDAGKVAPFDHGGTPAYRAYVYQCADGKPVVAYLERVSEAGRAKVADAATQPAAEGDSPESIRSENLEIKKPGASDWVPVSSDRAADIVNVKCPGGGSPVDMVSP